ncbi:MAG: zinc ABC transporter substrate-binding protein [Chloroflexi bacterium]|nr:zinc ABC transporter substrate-binding protein [Chloroflexota bacterium]MCY3956698.1 zinc ABC transporter substrate-binding protein [Chloroflexota bacterium]
MRAPRVLAVAGATAICALVLTACGATLDRASTSAASNLSPVAREEGRPLRVVATTGQIADTVRRVGGTRVVTHGLMGPGVDPHVYRASESDITRLETADAVFWNGLHLEAGISEVLERIGDLGVHSIRVTDAIDRGGLLAPPEFEGAYDPHVWFDLDLWSIVVETIRDALTEMDPDGASVYRANAAAYIAQIAELDVYVKARALEIEERVRVLVTAHDAFNYFANRYGMEVRGLQGISTEGEASTADVQKLAKFISDREIPAIFIESSVPDQGVQAVIEAAAARGHTVIIGGEIFSDAMGAEGTDEGTYLGMIRHNIDTIVEALRKA